MCIEVRLSFLGIMFWKVPRAITWVWKNFVRLDNILCEEKFVRSEVSYNSSLGVKNWVRFVKNMSFYYMYYILLEISSGRLDWWPIQWLFVRSKFMDFSGEFIIFNHSICLWYTKRRIEFRHSTSCVWNSYGKWRKCKLSPFSSYH